jgi:hypothetical protein
VADRVGKDRDLDLGLVAIVWEDQGDGSFAKRTVTRNMVWDEISLTWVRQTQTGASGGGGSGTLKTEMRYDADGNLLYYGRAIPGSATSAAVWQIRKYLYPGAGPNQSPTEVLYANGSTSFDQIFDNRGTLSYS